jgi:hypothetical protein
MCPPHQRLHPRLPLPVQRDDRLVEQEQLIALDGVLQLGPEPGPIGELAVHVGGEVGVAAAGLVLGDVHRDVRAPQQLAGVVIPGTCVGDPDAGVHEQLMVGGILPASVRVWSTRPDDVDRVRSHVQ